MKRVLLSSAVLAALASVAGGYILLLRPAIAARQTATALLSATRAIRVGSSDLKGVESLVREYRGRISDAEQCAGRGCVATIQVTNSRPRSFHFFAWAEFSVQIAVDHGRVIHVSAGLVTVRYGSERIAQVQDDAPGSPFFDTEQGWRVVRVRDADGIPAKLLVHLTPDAPDGLRESAFAFDFACMTKLGGCTTAAQLSPVWNSKYVDATRTGVADATTPDSITVSASML